MKDSTNRQLTIIVETTKDKRISRNIRKSLHNLEKKLDKSTGLRLSFSLRDENNKAVDTGLLKNLEFTEQPENNESAYISPENWNYWPG